MPSLRVVVIVPAFNEGKVLFDTLSPVVQSGYKVVCVDDGSSDNTSSEALRAGAIIIRHQLNLGQGAALETGLEYLRRNFQIFDYAVTFDGDGQHDLACITDMVKTIQISHADVVLGTRFGSLAFQGGRIKSFLLKLSARVAKKSLGVNVSDRHNGLRLFSREAVMKIKLENLGFGHADEILRKIQEHKLSYVECPVSISYTEYSKSKGQPLINLMNIIFDTTMEPK